MKVWSFRVLLTVILSILALAALQCSRKSPTSPQGEESVQGNGFVQLNLQMSKPLAQVVDSVVVIAENLSTGNVVTGGRRVYSKETTVLLEVPVGAGWIITAKAYSGGVLCFQGGSSQPVEVVAGQTVTVEINADDPVDKDQDGLSNWRELSLGTNPSNPDTDGDGLKDGDEVDVHGSDPTKADTDNDGLDDGQEVQAGTDLLNRDTDGDTFLDGEDLFPKGNAKIRVVLERLMIFDVDFGPLPAQIMFTITVYRYPLLEHQKKVGTLWAPEEDTWWSFNLWQSRDLNWSGTVDVDDNIRYYDILINMGNYAPGVGIYSLDIGPGFKVGHMIEGYNLTTESSIEGNTDGITEGEDGRLDYRIKTVVE